VFWATGIRRVQNERFRAPYGYSPARGPLLGWKKWCPDVVKDRKSKYKLTLKTKSSEPRHQAKMPIGYDSDPATD
jgi:hypothetical protein